MRNLWQFRKKYGGVIETVDVDIRDIIPSRPFVLEEKILRYVLYEGVPKDPGMIDFDGKTYLIEGHHRCVANYRKGIFVVQSDILRGSDFSLGPVLAGRERFNMETLVNSLR